MVDVSNEKSVEILQNMPVLGFFSSNDVIEEGDTVIIYVSYGTIFSVEVKRGKTLNMKYGALKHEYLIGKRYGSRISATAGYIYVIRPNAELWTLALTRRTQILYTADCGLILMLLDLKPGSVVCECGTGSGSLSHNIAMAIAPTGHLYTHDVDAERVKQVEVEFKKHGLERVTTCVHQNVLEKGFVVNNACDALFLDLPAPWAAIGYAKQALSHVRGGRIVSFSPCIEQVERVCSELRSQGFVQIETVELIPRKLKVCEITMDSLEVFNKTLGGESPKEVQELCSELPIKRKRLEVNEFMDCNAQQCARYSLLHHPPAQPVHTGYITSATFLAIS